MNISGHLVHRGQTAEWTLPLCFHIEQWRAFSRFQVPNVMVTTWTVPQTKLAVSASVIGYQRITEQVVTRDDRNPDQVIVRGRRKGM